MRARGFRAVTGILSLALIAGCGSSSGGGGSGSAAVGSALQPPKAPTADECQADALKTTAKPETDVPPPGTYTYKIKGERRELSSSGVATALAPTAPSITTKTLSVGNLRCFRVQRKYTPKLADTLTFVIRGGDIYISKLDLFVAGKTYTVDPKPPIKAADQSNPDWQGNFSGPTSGNYTGTAVGTKTISALGKKQKALGVELRMAFGGAVKGTTRQTNWISLNKGILLSEDVTQDRSIGGRPVRLSYKSQLESAP